MAMIPLRMARNLSRFIVLPNQGAHFILGHTPTPVWTLRGFCSDYRNIAALMMRVPSSSAIACA
jgi:hypothetical protein